MSAKPQRRAGLSDDDRAVWRHVTRTVKRLHADDLPDSDPEAPPARPSVRAPATARAVPAHPPARGPGLDGNTARRLKRGQMPCDGRLDLHGHTLAEAHRAAERFIAAMAARGARCVHIVTGKGERGGGARTIRSELLHWLAAPRLAGLILATAPAHPRDGGAGAFYVLLRRKERVAAPKG
ncbi:MAG: Smr/MutS family protein [Rhodospirillaceae bacterium]|nr:Smr/MutS family protein [Rhodospirillaceae bacterium]